VAPTLKIPLKAIEAVQKMHLNCLIADGEKMINPERRSFTARRCQGLRKRRKITGALDSLF
jgi:hypothetical protein